MKNGMIQTPDGTRMWYQNNLYHRADGPAFEQANGHREWYRYDLLHRTDGPAVEYANGNYGWWLLGAEYTFDQWLQLNPALDNQKRTLYRLKYGQ